MPDDFDIPDVDGVDAGSGRSGGGSGSSGGGGGGRGGRRRWPWLAAGLVLGVCGALFLPSLLGPYLPDSFRSDRLRIRGEVLKKRVDAERLLLTVESDSGAMLATFRRRISAIDLLVEPGDSVTLLLDRYRPFVEDPGLQGVRKGREPAGEGTTTGRPSADGDTAPEGAAAEETGSAGDSNARRDSAAAGGGG